MRNSTRLVLALALAAVLAFSSSAAALARGKTPPVTNPMDFARWTSLADWNSGTFDRIMPVMTGDPAGNGGLVLDPADGLLTGTDTAGMYNSGDYYYGTYTTPVVVTDIPFNWAVASWDATTPEGTWLQLEITAQRADGTWTKWYNMGVWAFETVTVRRHSVYGQADKDGTVDTDTLKLGKAAVAYQCRLTLFTADPALTPQVNLISVIVQDTKGELTAMAPGTAVSDPTPADHRGNW